MIQLEDKYISSNLDAGTSNLLKKIFALQAIE
jgi:hypothetical protein